MSNQVRVPYNIIIDDDWLQWIEEAIEGWLLDMINCPYINTDKFGELKGYTIDWSGDHEETSYFNYFVTMYFDKVIVKAQSEYTSFEDTARHSVRDLEIKFIDELPEEFEDMNKTANNYFYNDDIDRAFGSKQEEEDGRDI